MTKNLVLRWVFLTFVALTLLYLHAIYTGRLHEQAAIEASRWRIGEDSKSLKPNDRPFDTVPVSDDVFRTPLINNTYTRALVVARKGEEDMKWITERLGHEKLLEKYIFVVDDPNAAWKIPANKGHEAMAYLSYIIQRYDSLSDVSIFMHYHRETWHNNDLLALDAAAQVQRLNPNKIIREGYMNLRCHMNPGCGTPLRPGTTDPDPERPEEQHLAAVWPKFFPDEPIPKYLRQPCCGQFAVSRDCIRSLPKSRYEAMQKWLLETTLDDATAGRVFEYTWHFMFTKTAEVCPSEHICYCDGYGVCFESEEEYKAWFELKNVYHGVERQFWELGQDQTLGDERWLATDRATELRTRMRHLLEKLMGQWKDAIVRGNDPEIRAQKAHRLWKLGDGF